MPDVCVVPLEIQGEEHHKDANDTLGYGDLKPKVGLIYQPFSHDGFFDLLGEYVEYLTTDKDKSIFVIKGRRKALQNTGTSMERFVQGAKAEQYSHQNHAAGDYMSFMFLTAAAISAHKGVQRNEKLHHDA